MKLAPDSDLDHWLSRITGAADHFDWDAGNRSKGRKHGVEPLEVQSLFERVVFLAGRIMEPVHDEPRWLLVGETSNGRRLALIFTRRGSMLRPISCRPMRRNERRLYDQAKESLEDSTEKDRES
jgi:uncharacterized DUF497 family protein